MFNFDKNNSEKYITINLAKGDQCLNNKEQNYSIIYNISCDESVNFTLNLEDFNPDKCVNIIQGKSKEACGILSRSSVQNFLMKYKLYIGLSFIAVGIYLGFFGAYFIHMTIVFLMEIFVIIIMFKILMIIDIGGITILIICGIIIIEIGILSYMLEVRMEIFIGLVGGIFGFILGTIIYDFIGIYFRNNIAYYILIFIGIGIFGVLGYIYRKLISIIGTTTIGSYLIIRGLSYVLDGYLPYIDESIIKELISRGFDSDFKISGLYYIYLLILAFLITTGILVQNYLNKNKSDDDYKNIVKNFNEAIKELNDTIV